MTQAAATAAVTALYQQMCGRAPDAGGLAGYVNALMNGTPLASLVLAFASSAEVTNDLGTAYANAFGQAPTAAQLSGYEQAMVAGASLASEESPWVAAIQAAIATLYLNVLGRTVDAGGLASATTLLLHGTSLASLRASLAGSAESLADLGTAYADAYGQAASPAILAAAVQSLAAGASQAQVEAPWVANAQAAVTQLYETIDQRAPDAAGLASYVNAMMHGTSLAAIRALFATSAETQADLAAAWQNVSSKAMTAAQLAAAEQALAGGATMSQVVASWYNFVPASSAPPQIWFAPLDPYMQAVTGLASSTDYMSLFTSAGDAWAANATVFKISTQFAEWGSATELQTIFAFLAAHHIALAIEGLMLPLTPGSNIGVGVEGYNGPAGSIGQVAARIAALGGKLQYVAMDEPLYFGHQYQGTNAAQTSITTLAAQVAVSVAALRAVFPQVQVGDIEPLPLANQMPAWEAAYQTAVGSKLAFVQADVPLGTPLGLGLEEDAAQLAGAGIPFGMIYDGDAATAQTDAGWVNTAEGMLAQSEDNPLLRPQDVTIQTWVQNPSLAVPQGNAGSLANLLAQEAALAAIARSGALSSLAQGAVGITAPSEVTSVVGHAGRIAGVQLTAPAGAAATLPIALVIVADSGALNLAASSGVTIQGGGSAVLTLLGTAASLDAALAGLNFNAAATGAIALSFTAYDGANAPTTAQASVLAEAGSLVAAVDTHKLVQPGTATSFSFLGGDELVLPGDPRIGTASAAPVLQNFPLTSAIDLTAIAPGSVTGLSFTNGVLSLSYGTAGIASLQFAAGATGTHAFAFAPDQSGHGTLISLV